MSSPARSERGDGSTVPRAVSATRHETNICVVSLPDAELLITPTTRRSRPRHCSLSRAMTSPTPSTIKRTEKYLLALIVAIIAASAIIIVATPAAAAVVHTSRSVTSVDGAASASQAFKLVNQERTKAGCSSMQLVSKLQIPAERQSRDQAARDRMGHDGPNGATSNSRLSGLGYSRWAENVAQFQSAQAAVNFWSTSPGHRATMRNCAFRETGLAVARSNSGRLYWTQTFGG